MPFKFSKQNTVLLRSYVGKKPICSKTKKTDAKISIEPTKFIFISFQNLFLSPFNFNKPTNNFNLKTHG